MKKNRPSSFPSPSVQELIKLYEQAAQATPEAQSSENLSRQPVPRSTNPSPHRRENEQTLSEESATATTEAVDASLPSRAATTLMRGENTQRQQNPETLYTAIAPQGRRGRRGRRLSPIVEENEQAQPVSREEQTLGATAASRPTLILSEEQITAFLQHNRLVRAYQKEIQRLCKIVYGNPHALQEKIQEIQKNPSTGNDLSLQMKVVPQGLHNIAGRQMFGMKTGARRTAEENLPALCGVLECYVEAVKEARENLSITPLAMFPYYEETMGKEAVAQILQTSPHSERENASLAKDEMTDKVRHHPMVRRHQAQIQYWCQVVFGKADILQQQTEELFANPAKAEELSWQLAACPQSFGSYAGVSVGHLKNKTRKHAETGLSHLISAVDNCANVIQQAKESLLQTQQALQTCHHESSSRLTQVSSTSPNLSENLSATPPHHEAAQSSSHQPESRQDAQPRKAARPKALALAS